MRWFITLAVFAGTVGSAAAQTGDSVVATGSVLMGCRALVENDLNGDPMQMGACAGAVRAALDISNDVGRACPAVQVSRAPFGARTMFDPRK